jgi:hypothetical protein
MDPSPSTVNNYARGAYTPPSVASTNEQQFPEPLRIVLHAAASSHGIALGMSSDIPSAQVDIDADVKPDIQSSIDSDVVATISPTPPSFATTLTDDPATMTELANFASESPTREPANRSWPPIKRRLSRRPSAAEAPRPKRPSLGPDTFRSHSAGSSVPISGASSSGRLQPDIILSATDIASSRSLGENSSEALSGNLARTAVSSSNDLVPGHSSAQPVSALPSTSGDETLRFKAFRQSRIKQIRLSATQPPCFGKPTPDQQRVRSLISAPASPEEGRQVTRSIMACKSPPSEPTATSSETTVLSAPATSTTTPTMALLEEQAKDSYKRHLRSLVIQLHMKRKLLAVDAVKSPIDRASNPSTTSPTSPTRSAFAWSRTLPISGTSSPTVSCARRASAKTVRGPLHLPSSASFTMPNNDEPASGPGLAPNVRDDGAQVLPASRDELAPVVDQSKTPVEMRPKVGTSFTREGSTAAVPAQTAVIVSDDIARVYIGANSPEQPGADVQPHNGKTTPASQASLVSSLDPRIRKKAREQAELDSKREHVNLGGQTSQSGCRIPEDPVNAETDDQRNVTLRCPAGWQVTDGYRPPDQVSLTPRGRSPLSGETLRYRGSHDRSGSPPTRDDRRLLVSEFRRPAVIESSRHPPCTSQILPDSQARRASFPLTRRQAVRLQAARDPDLDSKFFTEKEYDAFLRVRHRSDIIDLVRLRIFSETFEDIFKSRYA